MVCWKGLHLPTIIKLSTIKSAAAGNAYTLFAKMLKQPGLVTHLRRAGHLPVVRDDPRASLKSMSDAAKIIRERNLSVLLFPEGGRSMGELKEFKEGAAYIAIKAGVPMVPIGILGTRKVLPMGSMQIMSGVVRLRIGTPISTSDLTLKDRAPLTMTLREKVAELVGQSVPKPQETR